MAFVVLGVFQSIETIIETSKDNFKISFLANGDNTILHKRFRHVCNKFQCKENKL